MGNILISAYFFFAAMFMRPAELTGPATAAANYVEERKQELIADRFGSLFTTLATKHGFNGDVLLSHNGKVVYENAFGYSDLKRKTPLNIESTFQLASVSKQFTSAAILMLHDQGKLEFSDSVGKFFPDFPYKNVTIRLLLGHRSGIPDYMNFAGRYWNRKSGFLTNSDLMDMLVTYHPRLEFKPDQRYKYSNTGYAILASIVEKISGVTYAEFMAQHVFSPLGMRNTFVFDPNNRQTSRYETKGYNKNCRPASEDFLSGVVGDKGVYSTVDDMYKWDQALYTDNLVKQETLEEAFTPLSDTKRHGSYGYGWRIGKLENGDKIVYHAGWWRGYNSLFVRRLEDKTLIIVLSNKVNWCFRNIEQLLDVVDSPGNAEMALRGE
jgi:CubicO group peptidase (beta-lactamase class C family)